MRICNRCKKELPTSAFHRDRHDPNGLNRRCKQCMKETSAAKRTERKAAGLCHCGRAIRGKRFRSCLICRRRVAAWFTAHPGMRAETHRRCRSKAREETFAHYGKECACCGETRQEFLNIDHPENNGAQHRKEIGSAGWITYTWLRRHGFPSGYRTLCYNCNCARGVWGYCPHEIERSTMKESGDVIPARAEDHAPMYLN